MPHFRTDTLRRIGGWDAYNVTEDADLGIRLARLGYRSVTIPSVTLEEAPIAFGAWLRQRSRWMKGWMHLLSISHIGSDHNALCANLLLARLVSQHHRNKPAQSTKSKNSRLCSRIETILDVAKAKGFRQQKNPARWRGHLDHLLHKPAKLSRGHHAATPHEDVPAFLADLRKREAIAGLALKFCILTAARSG